MNKIKKSIIIPQIIAGLIPLLLLIPVYLKVHPSMLLLERFFEGYGWIEIIFLDIYSILLISFILNKNKVKQARIFYWSGFSFVFFIQFILGLTVDERFLMSGEMHLPVPALIVSAPIFRGERFFMPILLISTIIIAGPAWCSHLCYMGAWDNLFANNRKPKQISQKKTLIIGYTILVLVLILTVTLKLFEVSNLRAFYFALIFGIIGVFTMMFVSRKLGYMFHCTVYCPIGRIVALLSKIYPARLRIKKDTCTLCNQCTSYCKYNALEINNIKEGVAGWNCTLCGDCIQSCHSSSIYLSVFKSKKDSFKYYLAIVVGLHTVFLALARL